ncbi:MAG: hypothetical protein RJB13_1528 [Pseudomonadota bacterium]
MKTLAAVLIGLVTLRAEAASWWYEQAERLQLVSASLLDGAPIAEPVPTTTFIEARLLTSLLPKPDPTVGAKQEKVPAAPLHTIPTFVAGFPFTSSGRFTLVGTGWGGYLLLPKSIASTMGVKATLNQYIAGASLESFFRLNSINLITSVGGQFGSYDLEGAITADDGEDSFSGSLTSFYLSQGVQARKIPLWANMMLLVRRGKSTFKVGKEKTVFIRSDTMADADLPLAAQITVGYTLFESLQLAASEYMVPNRSIMPRVSMAYQYVIGKADTSKVENSGVKKKKRRKKRNNTRSL